MKPIAGLPPEIQVIASSDAVKYRLPRRRLSRRHLQSALFGLVLTLVVIVASTILMTWLSGDGAFRYVAIAFGAFAACLMVMAGLSHVYGHVEVELGGGELRTIEHIGPLRTRRGISVDLVTRLVVEHMDRSDGGDGPETTSGSPGEPRLAEIVVEARRGPPLRLASGYPRAWLRALAGDLVRRIKSPAPDPLFHPPPARIRVVDTTDEADQVLEEPKRPAGSDIVVARHPGGVLILIPPPGFGRSGGGLTILLGSMFLVGVALAPLQAAGIQQGQGSPWPAFAISLGVGLPLVLWGIDSGRRRVELGVSGDLLGIKTVSPLRCRGLVWGREELVDIRTGDSAREIDDRPVPELQVHTTAGATFGFLAGRDADELAFLAAALRRSLDLPAKSGRLRVAQR